MCMLLRKSYGNRNFTTVSQWFLNFYTRRLKRIVPLYFLLILSALLAVFTVFPYTAMDSNVNSGKTALFFISNRMKTDDDNYFTALSIAVDVFTHTWSLTVEVQYYLLVPILYMIGAKLGDKLEIAYHAVLGFLSIIYALFFCSQPEAFNSVLARVWQFSVGMISYLIVDSKHGKSQEKYTLLFEKDDDKIVRKTSQIVTYYQKFINYLPILMVLGAIFPFEFSLFFYRPIVTVLTGISIVSSSSSMLEFRFLTYFGDVSYSLYLIHWPIYAYWKLMLSHGQTWNSELILALGFSILLAVLSYELFEKWYLKQSNSTIFIFCFTLFTLNLGLLYQNDIANLISPPPTSSRLDGLQEGEIVSYYKAEKLNRQWSSTERANMGAPSCVYEGSGPLGFCRHKELDEQNGKFKMMLIGNSWAANHATLFYEECGYKSKSIVQESLAGCEPLYPHLLQRQRCLEGMDLFEKEITREKPDYLFIFARFVDLGAPMLPNVTSLNEDHIYQTMKTQLEKYSRSVTQKVFMMHQIAQQKVLVKSGDHMAQAVLEKKNLVEFDKSLVDVDPEMARRRYEKLTTECSKCELFDYKPYFFNETTQTWRFYDEANAGLSYMLNGVHLSYHGLELIRPVMREVCQSL